ncbi:MAG: hypothetical protein J1F02_07875 [Lachnospiraceae bacterium]|nr:hypothetical protein [Lachnospiraceae bacterium]
MKLDYASLISPAPYYLEQAGHIKSPLLRDIFCSGVTYPQYNMYLSLLLTTPKHYCEKVNPANADWYQALDEAEKSSLSMYDMILMEPWLQSSFLRIFQFFFTEEVVWSEENQLFLTYGEEPEGTIHRENFSTVCDVILQRCYVSRPDTSLDPAQVTSKKAQAILKKIQAGRKQRTTESSDKDMELPNLITAIAVKSHSINFTNIWDLTIYQLYEQFKREQSGVYFEIQKMSVAAYGNKENSFKGNEWYTANQA